jgi:type II restriction/modification system DNA methylase subunit YeeA
MNDFHTLHRALVDLYLSLKEELAAKGTRGSQVESEKEFLLDTNPHNIFKYIKSVIDILVNTKVEKALKKVKEEKQHEDTQQELELLTQNLEAEVRLHIRVSLVAIIDGTATKIENRINAVDGRRE